MSETLPGFRSSRRRHPKGEGRKLVQQYYRLFHFTYHLTPEVLYYNQQRHGIYEHPYDQLDPMLPINDAALDNT